MSNHKSTESALKNLEVQVGQLAKQIADKSSNSFVANTEKNPKEECKVVVTRSKRFVETEDEDSVVVPKKKVVEKKGTDDTKDDVRGESNQEKEKLIMVKKKKLNDQEKENENEKKNKSEERLYNRCHSTPNF